MPHFLLIWHSPLPERVSGAQGRRRPSGSPCMAPMTAICTPCHCFHCTEEHGLIHHVPMFLRLWAVRWPLCLWRCALPTCTRRAGRKRKCMFFFFSLSLSLSPSLSFSLSIPLPLWHGSFCPLRPKDGPETPIFIVFSRFLGSAFSVSPNHPLPILRANFGVFEILSPKTRQKIVKHGGQIVWPGFPPRFSPVFTGFLSNTRRGEVAKKAGGKDARVGVIGTRGKRIMAHIV